MAPTKAAIVDRMADELGLPMENPPKLLNLPSKPSSPPWNQVMMS
jgi:hypothetical protein